MISIYLALCLSIFLHELGHFLVAKIFNVKVDSVQLFLYPIIAIFLKGTLYRIGFIPLIGYVNAKEIYSRGILVNCIYWLSGVFVNLFCYVLSEDIVFKSVSLYFFVFNLFPLRNSDLSNLYRYIKSKARD